MQIDFIEEYPTEGNLKKLSFVRFPASLYLGCKNIDDFLKLKNKIKTAYKNIKEIIYWPILEKSEGYWLSAFTKTRAIKRVLKEIADASESFPILWDAELPVLNPKLFITELFNISENKKLITSTLQNQNPKHPLIVAEVPRNRLTKIVFENSATSFSFTNYHRMDMLYSSALKVPDKENYLRTKIRENKKKYQKYSVALGLIGLGEDKTASIISPQDLDQDLHVTKEEGIREVAFYRLGGLNEEYLKVIEKYL